MSASLASRGGSDGEDPTLKRKRGSKQKQARRDARYQAKKEARPAAEAKVGATGALVGGNSGGKSLGRAETYALAVDLMGGGFVDEQRVMQVWRALHADTCAKL